ncbi:hypothetical protein J6590_021687 [Homalodisca vitripennis]|nr:hypothetical protein J6590_021687 [Homalodisca vitripennis]
MNIWSHEQKHYILWINYQEPIAENLDRRKPRRQAEVDEARGIGAKQTSTQTALNQNHHEEENGRQGYGNYIGFANFKSKLKKNVIDALEVNIAKYCPSTEQNTARAFNDTLAKILNSTQGQSISNPHKACQWRDFIGLLKEIFMNDTGRTRIDWLVVEFGWYCTKYRDLSSTRPKLESDIERSVDLIEVVKI